MASLDSFVKDPLFKRFYLKLIIGFLILLAAMGSAWYGFGELQRDLAFQQAPKVKKLNQLQSQVVFLQKQLKLYEQYGAKYEQLIAKGLVTKQDRVLWADRMIQVQRELLLPEFSFDFQPEKPLSNSLFDQLKVPRSLFFFSRIRLKLTLQHEGDLLRLLEAINAKVSPIYLVESCSLETNESGPKVVANFDLEQGNMTASCVLVAFHTHKLIVEK